jgi:DNA-binding transcriptional MerR regulator
MEQLRMREVMKRTGLSRQAIHFYIEAELVPPPTKTGRTMAYYSEAHVERILLIKKLQEEHFLPLKAIRAMLDNDGSEFTRPQQQILREVRARLPATRTRGASPADVLLTPLLSRIDLSRREVAELERTGFVRVEYGKVSADDAWLIELWAAIRRAGFTRELGFGPELLAMVERGVERIFGEEKQILARLINLVPAAKVADMVERGLPLVHAYLIRLHEAKVRAMFAGLDGAA